MAFLEGIFVNLNNYQFDSNNHIGSGAYGMCYIVTDKLNPGTQLCAKITQDLVSEAKAQEELLREVVVLKNVKHNAILGFKGFNLYDFDHNPKPTIITEFMKNGALDKMLEKEAKGKAPKEWNVTKKQIAIIGVAAAMRYLHRKDLMHRDLKPANVLLDDKLYPKVCDFGFARATLDLQQVTTRVGSPVFMAPEILHGDDDYDNQVDIYSFAILAYQVCTNKMPYEKFFRTHRNPGFVQLANWVYDKKERPSFDGCNVSKDFQDLIKSCWEHNPKDRPSFDSIYDRLTDNMQLVINDDVNMSEVYDYIDLIQANDSTKKGKAKLSLSNSFVLNDDRPPATPNPTDVIPESEEARLDMLKKSVANFSLYNTDVQFVLYTKLLGRIIGDDSVEGYKNIVKITYFANNQAANNNKKAVNFLKEAFGHVLCKNKDTLSSSDLPSSTRTRFNISPTVTRINENAFQGRQILYINLPPSIVSIEACAFKNCNKLTWVSLNNQMTVINEGTFENCSKLVYVELPHGLKTIKKNAFKKCTSLAEIEIPESVKEIEANAFQGCKNLKKVRISPKTTYNKKLSFPLRANIQVI